MLIGHRLAVIVESGGDILVGIASLVTFDHDGCLRPERSRMDVLIVGRIETRTIVGRGRQLASHDVINYQYAINGAAAVCLEPL
jgi:hypothetical protein